MLHFEHTNKGQENLHSFTIQTTTEKVNMFLGLTLYSSTLIDGSTSTFSQSIPKSKKCFRTLSPKAPHSVLMITCRGCPDCDPSVDFSS